VSLPPRHSGSVIVLVKTGTLEEANWSFADVRFGSKADMCVAKRHVCFTPNSDRESGHPQEFMSALPPKADRCSATRDVRFGPKADIGVDTTCVRTYPCFCGRVQAAHPSCDAAAQIAHDE